MKTIKLCCICKIFRCFSCFSIYKIKELRLKMLDLAQCQKPGKRMTFRGIRTTKFRHVFGAPAKKEKCFENVRITRNAHESNYCAVNPKFLGLVVEVGGGGSFIVLQIDKTGRVDHNVCKVTFIY